LIQFLLTTSSRTSKSENVKTRTTEEQRGYSGALIELRKNGDPQKMFDTSLSDLNQTGFAEGWQQACREAGAKHPYEDGEY
jgi:hypothetical protein